MKGLTWKKIMSLVLVAALVIGCLQLNAKKVSADAGAVASGALVDGDSAIQYTVNREAVQTGGELAEVNAVIVFDASNSMYKGIGNGKTRLGLALQEIGAFVAKLGNNVNVQYVAFAEYAIELTKGSDGEYYGYISQLGEGGTNIDAGIEKAQSLLKNKTNPTIIILTDGEPTYATIGNGGKKVGNGSDDPRYNEELDKVKSETSDQIGRATKDDKITVYAIRYGNDPSIFTGRTDVKNYNAGFSSESLAAEFSKILTEINNYVVDHARIEAQLGKYVEYVPSDNDTALGISYANKLLTWNIPNQNIASGLTDTIPSPKFNFEIIDPANPTQTDKTEIVKALITTYNADPAKAEAEGLKVETDAKGKVKITVAVTAPNATWLYYSINGGPQERKAVNTLGTLTKTFFEGAKPTTTWTIQYTVDTVLVSGATETVTIPFDETLNVTYKTPDQFGYTGQYTRGTVTTEGTTVTVPYTEDDKYTVSFYVDGGETAVTTRTAYVGSAITDIPSVETYKTSDDTSDPGKTISYTISGWNDNNGVAVDFTKTDADYNVYAVNTPSTTYHEFTLYINYIIDGEEAPFETYEKKYQYTATTEAVDSPVEGMEDYYVSQETVDSFVMPNHDVTIDVVYSAKPVYTVSFYTQKENEDPVFATSIPVVEGGSVERLPDVPGIGVFETAEKITTVTTTGWDKTLNDLTNITGDVTVTAPLAVSEEAQKYELVINYFYIDAETRYQVPVADQISVKVPVGESYSYTSPTVDRFVLADADQKVISGTMPAAKTVVDVEYKHLYKVAFVVDDVEETSFDVVDGLGIEVPSVERYKKAAVDNEYESYEYSIFGWFDKEEQPVNAEIFMSVSSDITVYAYNVKGEVTVKTYPLTITYISNDGKISNTFTASLKYNDPYEIVSPVYEGYDVDKAVVEGIMPAKAVSVVVNYTVKAPVIIINEDDDPTPSPTQGAEIKIVLPTPTEDPTPTPTEVPATPTPTAEPTPVEEEPIEIEETETPEGDVDLEETETPQAAPEEEEELEVEPIDTPQGDLPQTGVASSAVFFGIGAACVLFGGVVVLKNRRREEM